MAAGATYDPIATTTLSSASASITFSSIPSTYTDLRVILTGASDTAGVDFRLRFNSDTATNYSLTNLYGYGTSANSTSATNQTSILPSYAQSLNTTPQTFAFDIFSYAGSTYKTLLFSASQDLNGSGNVMRSVALWRSTSAINTIVFSGLGGNFNTGFTATLYGIKAA